MKIKERGHLSCNIPKYVRYHQYSMKKYRYIILPACIAKTSPLSNNHRFENTRWVYEYVDINVGIYFVVRFTDEKSIASAEQQQQQREKCAHRNPLIWFTTAIRLMALQFLHVVWFQSRHTFLRTMCVRLAAISYYIMNIWAVCLNHSLARYFYRVTTEHSLRAQCEYRRRRHHSHCVSHSPVEKRQKVTLK